MKRLTVSGIVSVSLALALMAGGCGKAEEKAEVPSKDETVTEQAVTEHAPAHKVAGTTTHTEAARESVMGMAAEKTEELQGTAEEHAEKISDESEIHQQMEEKASDVHETVKKKMLEGC